MKRAFTVLALAAAFCTAGIRSYADVISDLPSAVSSTADSPASSSASSGSGAASTAVSASGSTGQQASSSSSSLSASSSSSSAANPVPGTTAEDLAAAAEEIAVNTGSGDTVIVDVPGSAPDIVTSGSAGPGASYTGSSSSGTSVIAAPSQDSASASTDAEAGSKYASEAKVKVDLGFTVVSPNYDYNGFKVAEGSVQLSDGSWDSIGHDKYIRQPYYKLLREEGDWYVVSVNARRIGNYATPDGSTIKELWLKKSDCIARNYIELNTQNTQRQAIVKYALSLLGKGYQYAGSGPDMFDCSGFVNHVMSTNGISVARNSSEICTNGYEVGISGLRPGDIVGRSGHVGIYIGDGCFIHAAESSTGVITDSIAIYNRSSKFNSYRNVVGD